MRNPLAKSAALACAMTALAGAGLARADQIVLKNGDRLTGKIVSAADGKVQFRPDFAKAATLTLSEDDVATFSTDGPITLKLKDGAVLHDKVQQGAAGAVAVAPRDGAAGRTVQLASVALINPTAPPRPAWHGSVSANGLYSNAATSSVLAGVAADATRKTPAETLIAHASFNYGDQTVDHVTTASAENWDVSAKYNLNFSKAFYANAALEFQGDEVNALTLRLLPTLGAGYRWFDRGDFHLTTDVGVSSIFEDYRTLPVATDRTAISLAYHVDKSWDAGRIKIYNDVQLLPSIESDQFLAQTTIGLRTGLTKTMFSEIRADVSYDNHPAPEAKPTSSQLKLGLGWTY